MHAALLEAGFEVDPFVPTEGSYAPPVHYSFETGDRKLAQAAYEAGVAIMRADDDFQGYIESETVLERFARDIERSTYSGDEAFPLDPFHLVTPVHPTRKRSDLHVKRAASTSPDGLEAALLRVGFYPVRTERNRIFTLQFESVQDSRLVFDVLSHHLDRFGGGGQINFEVISAFERKPLSFRPAQIVPSGRAAEVVRLAPKVGGA